MGEDTYYELNICAEYLDRPLSEIARTILHEMAHLYNIQHDIKDVSNNGYYHNKRFKATAEDHGLIIEQDAKYGWTLGTLNAEAEAWLIPTSLRRVCRAAPRRRGAGGQHRGGNRGLRREA